MNKWVGKVAIVTGGASGLGYATAHALVVRGMKVAIFDVNVDAGEAAAAKLDAKFISVDVEYRKNKPPITSKPTHKNTYNQNTFTVRRLPIFHPPTV